MPLLRRRTAPRSGPPSEWLIGGGELGELIRSMDWSATPLGPREQWPLPLRTVVSLVVESRFPSALLWGRELTLLYNDAYRVIAAGMHPRAIGRSTREIWPEVWHINEPIFAAVLERGETVFLEDELFPIERHGQREEAYFTLCYSPVRGEDARVAGSLVTLLETTPRVRQQRALETDRHRAQATADRERELFAKIVDRIPVMVATYDPAVRSFHLNEEFRRVIGWTEEDTRDRDLMSLCYPDPRYREELQRFMASAEPGCWREVEVTAKDGSKVPSSWANVRLSDDTQVGIGIDLRERKRAEGALRASEQKFRSVFEQAAIGIARVRFADARWIDVNDAFCRMLGYTREELLATPWPQMTHPEDLDRNLESFRRMAEGELDSYTIEKRFKHRWGHHVWVRLTLSAVRDAQGRPDYEVAIIEDITGRKHTEAVLHKANERLRDADQRKDQFLAVLSHELRNPLAPIRNSVYLLQRASPGSDPAKRALAVIDRQVGHMTRLIDDLLDVTRISRGKIRLQRESLELNDVVRGAGEDLRELFRRNGIELEVAVPEQPLRASADPTRIAQIVGNLLQNAAKFTSPGGHACLSLRAEAGRAVIEVRDDGAGIPREMLGKLFEPFVQVDETLDRTLGGLGLGLALVKGLAELHGGTVSAASEGPGRGATFTVRLPLQGEVALSAATSP